MRVPVPHEYKSAAMQLSAVVQCGEDVHFCSHFLGVAALVSIQVQTKLFKQLIEHIHSGLFFSNGALTDSQVLLLMDLEYDQSPLVKLLSDPSDMS